MVWSREMAVKVEFVGAVLYSATKIDSSLTSRTGLVPKGGILPVLGAGGLPDSKRREI